VCESNSLSRVVEPGLFLQVRAASERTIKPSARAVADLVDRVVVSSGSDFDLPLDRISLLDGQWALQREACAVVIAGTPPAPSVRAALRAQFTQVEVASVTPLAGEDGGLMRALAIALDRSAHDWCLVVRGDAASIPAGAINAMFRRHAGAEAIVALGPSPCAPEPFVLVHRSLLPRVVGALHGTSSPAPRLSDLGRVKELQLAPQLPTGHTERS
jgi:molybdopterin-guanine dinucleotide biosynthesis protein A